IQSRLIELDKSFEQGKCADDLIQERSNLLKDLLDHNHASSLDMFQKAKIRWAIKGDENSKFFHGIINKKRSQLVIRGVLVDGDWIVDPLLVKHEFKSHFSNRFAAPVIVLIAFDLSSLDGYLMTKSMFLKGLFLMMKLKVRYGIAVPTSRLAQTVCSPAWMQLYDIALIPKMHEAKMVKDFRPISLIGSVYKIIAKVLANRLSLVISALVSEEQSTFVSNRLILDGPFILNELLSCWEYLDMVLHNFGFGSKWRSWIQGYLKSAIGSILVNGSPTSEFQFHKGLKQGDPLSPFLFILIMESLHLSFSNVVNAGLFNGIHIDSSFSLSHLFYADDVIFVGKWELSNLSTIVNVLKWFHLASGLKINLLKSKLMGIDIPHNVVVSAARSIGCSVMHTPFNYLRVTVGASMSRICSWDDVVAKLSSRISKWKLKTLSDGVLNRFEAIRRNFFNGVECTEMKLFLISWKKVLASKKNGGLGVSSFFALNCGSFSNGFGASLLMVPLSGLGYQLTRRHSCVYMFICLTFTRHSPWLDIVGEFKKLSIKGEQSYFWDDVWLSDSKFRDLYPRLYLLESAKNASVASKFRDISLTDSFRRQPRSGIEEEQLLHLLSKMSSVMLPNSNDQWTWSLDSAGIFSVKSARDFIDRLFLPKAAVPTRWVKYIPIKINIFAWRVFLDKLPTRLNLSLRGLDIPSILCPVCSIYVESTSHLLFSCHLARQLMSKVSRWWELEFQDFFSYDDWLLWFKNLRMSKRLKDVSEGVCYISWWVIWKFRNQILFGKQFPQVALLFDEIVRLSFFWCSNRCNCNFDWNSWMKNPSSLICEAPFPSSLLVYNKMMFKKKIEKIERPCNKL
ncbi:RNA-directed DNA polymerase, eukaryota, partial [Tanacetum coccineum]